MSTAGVAGTRCSRSAVTLSQARGTRLVAFGALAALGLTGWTGLLGGEGPTAGWLMTACALVIGGALVVAARASAPARRLLTAAAAVGAAAGALLTAGVPVALLVPDRWNELAAGIWEGLSAVPVITSPYSGDDQWIQSTVMLGGTGLAAIAALQAFWPGRRDGEIGSPVPAAMTLTLLYGVPVIEVAPASPFLSGSAFAVLLAAFLFADRVRSAHAGPAAVFVVVATLAGAALAPAIDADEPWVDLASISQDVANTGTVGYSWSHDYGPLTWPRDGRELLRIKAQARAYWKAEVLGDFDGHRWLRTDRLSPFEPDGEIDEEHPQWRQRIAVRVKGLRGRQFVTAGEVLELDASRSAQRVAGGTFVAKRGLLRRGATYEAQVYTPRPETGELRRAGTDYPRNARRWLKVEIPDADGRARPGRTGQRPWIGFASFDSGTADRVESGSGAITRFDVQGAVAGTGLERIYGLARRLRAGARRPYEFVEAVRDRVQRGATYTERPAVSSNPLDRFLFESRFGYCQQFSGAMALLLRMGGVPARVAVGFAPGRQDGRSGEYVVTDYDAHSWVEVYFPRLGWVTFDPTPAASPAREQTADTALALGVRRGVDGVAGDRLGDPRSGAADAGANSLPWALIAVIALSPAAVGAGLLLLRRTRRRRSTVAPELAELERALRVCGRPADAATTLSDLARTLMSDADARGYVDAIAAQRFAAEGSPPTARQRRAMRRELARGLGLSGAMRALWALPPWPAGRAEGGGAGGN